MNKHVTSKEAILAVSKDLATTQGLSAINMRAVATACGVAVGSVYNYFPSKADLVAATIESIWRSIFHQLGGPIAADSFEENVSWLFERIRQGCEAYPAFFTVHAMSFATTEKEKGRQVMEQYFKHMKQGLLLSLQKDAAIPSDVFSDHFTQEAFIDFVFENLLALLLRHEASCDYLLAIIRRIIYPI